MGSINGTEAAEEHGIRRSPRWPMVEKHFLASNPSCPACSDEQGSARVAQVYPMLMRGLQVHHAIMPFHFCILLGRPELELDPRNLVVLCENEAGVETQDHHLVLGHLLNFQSYMPDAKGAAAKWRGQAKDKIITDPAYGQLVRSRPKAWRDLSSDDRQALRNLLDSMLPRL